MVIKRSGKNLRRSPKNRDCTSLCKMRNGMHDIFNEFLSNYDEFWPTTNQDICDVYTPKSDIIETKDGYKIFMDMPGVEEENIEVFLDNGILNITGKKEHFEEAQDSTIHMVEREYGSFIKTLQLPDNASPDKIQANFRNGVLELVIPKIEESKRGVKRITITSR